MNLKFPKNVFSAFGILFLLSAFTVPVMNLLALGPDFSYGFYTSPEFTAEKASLAVVGLGLFFIYLAYKKKDAFIQ